MKGNIYLIVFGVIALIIAAAALSTLFFNKSASQAAPSLSNLQNYGPAPNIQGISAWINSQPINISELKGKVVIVDFWTYSCINCIRTIPFLNTLQKEYGNNGLVIIGVSTPEFQFEHNLTNVESAVKRFNITYAVALDNNYSTWDAYHNEYWPADYFIDKNGDIRYESFGESPSSFNETEQVVRELLENANYTLPSNVTNVSDILNFSQEISPEMYLGYQEIEAGRTNYFGNPQGLQPNEAYDYTLPNVTQADTIYLGGSWYSAPDSIIAENGSVLFLIYRAKYVNVVASGNGTNTSIMLKLDGQNLTSNYLGSDAHLVNGTAVVNVSASRLYNIIAAPSYGVHVLEIEADKNFRIYTFTFG
ncbi:MAG TPA: redoxin family protein [Candidatus Acidoferrum sp.]|nr:redoxin family protein [Candidatus Acidoferrum sp.]